MIQAKLIPISLQVPDVDDVIRLLLQEPANRGVSVSGLPSHCSVFRFETGPRAGYMGIQAAGEFGDWQLTQRNLTLAVLGYLPTHPTRFSF